MSSPSMVATSAREALTDKVVEDIRALLLHGFIPPEDGGSCDEALFNCLLACQGASPLAISLADLFEGQDGAGGSSESKESGQVAGVSDRRLVCQILKLALRRRQLTQLLRNFCTNGEVLSMWYADTAFVRHSSPCGSLLLLVRAVETGRPGLLSCLLTRPPFVEGMFSNFRDRACSVEQAVEVTQDMDINEFDEFESMVDVAIEPPIEHLSSSLKETLVSLMSFFTSGFASQSNSDDEGDSNHRAFTPSSTQSIPIASSLKNSLKPTSSSLIGPVDAMSIPRDQDDVIYQPLSASDLHISRLCVQPDLQPEHLFPIDLKSDSDAPNNGPELGPEASDIATMTSDFETMVAVFPQSESPVSQRLSALVTDISQRVVGTRALEATYSRQRRRSFQLFLSEGNESSPSSSVAAIPVPVPASSDAGVATSLPFTLPEEDIQLPPLSELRHADHETAHSSEGGDTLSMALSTSPDRLGPRARRHKERGSGGNENAPSGAAVGHRRVFSDGPPPEVLAQMALRTTSPLTLEPPSRAAPPPSQTTVSGGTDSDNASCQTCPSMGDDVPTLAIGPNFEFDNQPPDPLAALETCPVPGRITRTLYSALNFDISLENSRLLFLFDDLYAQGLCELETNRRMARLRRRLNFLTPAFGHSDLDEEIPEAKDGSKEVREERRRPRWASRAAAEEARVAEDAVSCAGEGTEVRTEPAPLLRDPLLGHAPEGPTCDGAEEVLALLPEDDPVRSSPTMSRLLGICLRAPDLHEKDSPTNLVALRLALLSSAVSQLLDEASSISASRAQQPRRYPRPDSADYLGPLHRRAKGAFSRNDAFLPPPLEIPSDVYSKKHRSEQLLAQQNRCAGCSQASPAYLAKRFRFCEYFGRFFCEFCHPGDSAMIIPARVLKHWDFAVYSVSVPATEFLKRLFPRPVFRPSSLMLSRTRALRDFDLLRKQLARFMPFLNTCRMATGVRAALNNHSEGQRYVWPRHWLWHEETRLPLYSMQDFSRLRWGKASDDLRAILRSCVEHVSLCPLCQAKGFICELCGAGNAIFPFEVHTTHQCGECGACFHLECWVAFPEGGNSVCCPRCARLVERHRRLSCQTEVGFEVADEGSKGEAALGSSPAVEAV